MEKLKDKVMIWLAWVLPRKLVYWCAIRVGAAATTGKFSETAVKQLLFVDALSRWEVNMPSYLGNTSNRS